MERLRHKTAKRLVAVANWLVNTGFTPTHHPYYRSIDSPDEALTGSKNACAAYSYEGLKSLVEQDGPDGFGATATVKWLISDEGWEEIGPDNINEVRRMFAMNGIDMDDDTGELTPPTPEAEEEAK